MRSNLTVGPPIEMQIYQADTFILDNYHRFEEDDEYLRELKKSWDSRLKEAFHQLPPLAWAQNWKRSPMAIMAFTNPPDLPFSHYYFFIFFSYGFSSSAALAFLFAHAFFFTTLCLGLNFSPH